MSTGKLLGGGGTQAWKGGFDEGKGGIGNFLTQTNSEGTAEKLRRGLAWWLRNAMWKNGKALKFGMGAPADSVAGH